MQTSRKRKGIFVAVMGGAVAAIIGVSIHSASASENPATTIHPQTYISYGTIGKNGGTGGTRNNPQSTQQANNYNRGCSEATRCRH